MSCCKGCEKRSIGCHSSCEDYIDYREELEQIKQIRNSRNAIYNHKYNRRQRFAPKRTDGILN